MNLLEIMKEFVRSIVIFSVLSAFCIHLLPARQYQKHAKFAIGLVYVCMIMDVICVIFGKTTLTFSF